MTARQMLLVVGRRLRSGYIRIRASAAKRELSTHTRLHLGCGSNLLNGWANIDLSSAKHIIRWDLIDPLPVSSSTIDFIYCEHFIEHLTLQRARRLLSECYRTLKPGGVLRLSTPNLRKLVDEYLLGRVSEWRDVGWNPATPCQMVNEGLHLWGHQFVYDEAELNRRLEEIGFRHVVPVVWRGSSYEELKGLECRPYHHEVILEAVK